MNIKEAKSEHALPGNHGLGCNHMMQLRRGEELKEMHGKCRACRVYLQPGLLAGSMMTPACKNGNI